MLPLHLAEPPLVAGQREQGTVVAAGQHLCAPLAGQHPGALGVSAAGQRVVQVVECGPGAELVLQPVQDHVELQRADRASAVLAVVGIVNVPIIHYSVTWWNSLHQAPSVMRLGKPTMPAAMLVPLLMMLLGFTLFFVALLLVRLRGEILSRERTASWIRDVVRA